MKKSDEMSRKVVIYARVSTVMQEEGDSLEFQIKKCKEYCSLYDYEVIEIITDVESGWHDEREGFLKLKNLISHNVFDLLVVYETSRISRKMVTLLSFVNELLATKIGFLAISQKDIDTSTDIGMLIFQIISSLAEYERKLISARVKSSKYARAKAGKWQGGTKPLGYDIVNKKLIPNAIESITIRKMFHYYIETQSLSKVGKKFKRHIESVRWILTNPLYIGKLKWGQKEKNPITRKQLTNKTYEIFDGEHEAIVEEDIFYKAQEIINERTSIRIAQARSDALFIGNLYCSCGAKMYNLSMKNKRFNYYKCENKECGKMIRREKVENKVIDLIFLNKELKKLDSVDISSLNNMDNIILIEEQLADTINEKVNLTKGYIKGVIEESIFSQLKLELNKKEKHLNTILEKEKKIIEKNSSRSIDVQYSKKLISILKELNFNNPDEIKEIRQILFLIVKEIRLKSSKEIDFDIYFNI